MAKYERNLQAKTKIYFCKKVQYVCKDVSDLETCMEYLFFLPNRTEKTVHSAVSLNIFGRLLDFFQRESSIFHNFFLEA